MTKPNFMVINNVDGLGYKTDAFNFQTAKEVINWLWGRDLEDFIIIKHKLIDEDMVPHIVFFEFGVSLDQLQAILENY